MLIEGGRSEFLCFYLSAYSSMALICALFFATIFYELKALGDFPEFACFEFVLFALGSISCFDLAELLGLPFICLGRLATDEYLRFDPVRSFI